MNFNYQMCVVQERIDYDALYDGPAERANPLSRTKRTYCFRRPYCTCLKCTNKRTGQNYVPRWTEPRKYDIREVKSLTKNERHIVSRSIGGIPMWQLDMDESDVTPKPRFAYINWAAPEEVIPSVIELEGGIGKEVVEERPSQIYLEGQIEPRHQVLERIQVSSDRRNRVSQLSKTFFYAASRVTIQLNSMRKHHVLGYVRVGSHYARGGSLRHREDVGQRCLIERPQVCKCGQGLETALTASQWESHKCYVCVMREVELKEQIRQLCHHDERKNKVLATSMFARALTKAMSHPMQYNTLVQRHEDVVQRILTTYGHVWYTGFDHILGVYVDTQDSGPVGPNRSIATFELNTLVDQHRSHRLHGVALYYVPRVIVVGDESIGIETVSREGYIRRYRTKVNKALVCPIEMQGYPLIPIDNVNWGYWDLRVSGEASHHQGLIGDLYLVYDLELYGKGDSVSYDVQLAEMVALMPQKGILMYFNAVRPKIRFVWDLEGIVVARGEDANYLVMYLLDINQDVLACYRTCMIGRSSKYGAYSNLTVYEVFCDLVEELMLDWSVVDGRIVRRTGVVDEVKSEIDEWLRPFRYKYVI